MQTGGNNIIFGTELPVGLHSRAMERTGRYAAHGQLRHRPGLSNAHGQSRDGVSGEPRPNDADLQAAAQEW